jgi:hypothetical protein
MNITPIKYPNLNKFSITVLSVSEGRIYLEWNETSFKTYPGKKINLIFNEIKYECIFGYYISIGISYFIYNPALAALVSVNQVLDIYDTFEITNENELPTFQDIIDYLKAKPGNFSIVNNILYQLYDESSKPGIISPFEKAKLEQLPLFIKSKQIQINNSDWTELLTLKTNFNSQTLTSPSYRLLIQDTDKKILDATISFYDNSGIFLTDGGVLFKVNHCSFQLDDDKLEIKFTKLAYLNQTYLKLETKLIGTIDTKFHEISISINSLDCLELPTAELLSSNIIIFNNNETSFIVDNNLYEINPTGKTILSSVFKTLQKFNAVLNQKIYTITEFVLNPDCLVFVNNNLQDVIVVGQTIELFFEPEGGEIIKVINVIS